MVINIHYRDLNLSLEVVWSLVDSLASTNDLLWPTERWPAMVLDDHLNVNSRGGHSMIRYYVEEYQSNSHVTFRFIFPEGFVGTHQFKLHQVKPNIVRLEHIINMNLNGKSVLLWHLAIRQLHDALIEDALDKAEIFMTGKKLKLRKLSLWVRFLRYVIRRKQQAKSAKGI